MATPVCKEVLLGTLSIGVLLLFLLPFYPLIVMSFEAGMMVGLLLHSSHTTDAITRGYLDQKS